MWRSWAGLRSRQRSGESGEYCYWISLFIFLAPLSLWPWSSPYWPCGSSGLALLNAGRGDRIRAAGIANRQGTCGPVPSTSPWNITRRMACCETANEQSASLHSLPSQALCPRGVQRKSARGRLRRFSWRRRGNIHPGPAQARSWTSAQPHGHSGERRPGRIRSIGAITQSRPRMGPVILSNDRSGPGCPCTAAMPGIILSLTQARLTANDGNRP